LNFAAALDALGWEPDPEEELDFATLEINSSRRQCGTDPFSCFYLPNETKEDVIASCLLVNGEVVGCR
uniref:hypothetical protein n=1 Tax=Thioalkalivibrio sp. HK1 TaxID=1469245 RepID=UPI0018CC7479